VRLLSRGVCDRGTRGLGRVGDIPFHLREESPDARSAARARGGHPVAFSTTYVVLSTTRQPRRSWRRSASRRPRGGGCRSQAGGPAPMPERTVRAVPMAARR